jgi:hypothetical protein
MRMRGIIRHDTWAIIVSPSQRLILDLIDIGRVVVHGPRRWWIKESIDVSHRFVRRRSLLKEN